MEESKSVSKYKESDTKFQYLPEVCEVSKQAKSNFTEVKYIQWGGYSWFEDIWIETCYVDNQ